MSLLFRIRRGWVAAILPVLVLATRPAAAQPAPYHELDAYVAKAMTEWKVPGLALAIVRNDSVIYTKGYGVRTLGESAPVDAQTMFAIGSSSKAFTATIAAMLVDERKLRWDAPITDYLAGFEMYDPYAARELTVRDALSHRSGLARGDLLWYGSSFGRDDILQRVRYLKPSWSFRSRFGYQNLMYLAAGQAEAKVAGRSWDDLVKERIFAPLGMTASNTSTKALAGRPNVATPHAELEDTLRTVPWRNIDNIAPAGSINSNITDMAQWVRFHLAGGKVGGKQIVSKGALDETYQPNVTIPLVGPARALNPETHLMAYGMGWFLQDYRGRLIIQHGGNIDGMSALVAFMPEERTGIVILTNMNGSVITTALMNRIFDAHLKAAPRDWSAELYKAYDAQVAVGKATLKKFEESRVAGTRPQLALEKYAGIYADSMYGEATVTYENGKLLANMGSAFSGELEHWHYDTFRAKWNDRMLGRSTMTFVLGHDGKPSEVRVEGVADFKRKPDVADTTAKVTLASSDLQRFTGTYVQAQMKVSVDVQIVSGALRLTAPGQPTYTLVADSPTRFRLTGPPGMPAGFFIEFMLEGNAVKGAKLIQPAPQPTMVFEKK